MAHSSCCISGRLYLIHFPTELPDRLGTRGAQVADGEIVPPKKLKSWRELAEELCREKDSTRIVSLSNDLLRAFEAEDKAKQKPA